MVDTAWCRMMAAYNRWTNNSIYDVCAAIPDDLRRKECGVFFKSIHGTLNHLCHADQMWMARFEYQPVDSHPFGEDLYAGFDELRAARVAMDERIEAWTEQLTDESLRAPFVFTSRAYDHTATHPEWVFVTHFFNHQAHHRGQLSVLISQLGFESPPMDIVLLPYLATLGS